MAQSHLRFDTIQDGSVSNILQFLTMDKATGCLKFTFGPELPRAFINLLVGKVTTAEFGVIYSDQVLCLLLCQESSLRCIEFFPNEHFGDPYEKSKAISDPGLSRAMLRVVAGMDTCTVRPSLVGPYKIRFPHSGKSAPVFQVLHDFDMVRGIFVSEPVVDFAPVHQCALFKKALSLGLVEYEGCMIKLSELRPLIKILEPLPNRDRQILLDLMKRVLPHSKASFLTLEDFLEFADLLEACAQERGKDEADLVQFKIYQLLAEKTGLDLVGVAQLRKNNLLKRLSKMQEPDNLLPVATSTLPKATEPAKSGSSAVVDLLNQVALEDSLPVPRTEKLGAPKERNKGKPSFFELFFDTEKALEESEDRH